MEKILVIYWTTDGQTKKICQRIQQIFERHNTHVTLLALAEVNLAEANKLDLACFDKIVIGASIRYGKHNVKVYDFINSHLAELSNKASAFFSVNLVARKPEKNTPETNPSLIKFLSQIAWQPDQVGVFAGKLNYPIYKFWDRLMIRFIMTMTKGPTDPTAVVEYTDWCKVEQFAQQFLDLKKHKK